MPSDPIHPRGDTPPSPMLCPICGRSVGRSDDSAADSLPFCGDRCKLIDLGRWLGGKYQVPADPDDKEEP